MKKNCKIKLVKLLSNLIFIKSLRRNFRDKMIDYIINHNFEFKSKPEFKYEENPIISIVMPVYNNFDITYKCLQSIYYYMPNVLFEIIIADDASTDETKNIEKLIPGIKVARTEGNFGFLKNVKNAIKFTQGKYIFLMNNDMIVTKGWLDYLYETLENDSQIGIAGSLLLNKDDSIQEYGCHIDGDGRAHFRIPEKSFNKLDMIEVDYCSGCAILFLKSDWDSLGGFDEQFAPAYYEDTDFSFSLRIKLGKKIVCQPLSRIYHLQGGTYSESAHQLSEINRQKFIKKWAEYLK